MWLTFYKPDLNPELNQAFCVNIIAWGLQFYPEFDGEITFER